MDQDTYSKRRLFNILSWVVVGLYAVLNVGVFVTDTPLSALVIILPIINIVLIAAWFFVRSLYNKAKDTIKHRQYLESKPNELPLPKYGEGQGTRYIPNLKIDGEKFNKIDLSPNNSVTFDITMKDYLKLGAILTFHDEMNYGSIKKVQVSKVTTHEKDIEVSFIAIAS